MMWNAVKIAAVNSVVIAEKGRVLNILMVHVALVQAKLVLTCQKRPCRHSICSTVLYGMM
jgi:hypothetical protein